MIKWLRRTNREQRKLLLSVGTNFLTRVPGAVGLLWFLPLLFVGLGTDHYATLLSAMALGSAAAFQSGGFNLAGRRRIGEAYAAGDQAGEADALASSIVATAVGIALSLSIIFGFCWIRSESTEFLVVASLTSAGLFLMMLDSARSAYNEHYITAGLLIVLQSVAYAVGFFVEATRQHIIVASFILSGPYWLTSLTTLALLVRDRPYLLGGRPNIVWPLVYQGTMLAIADGFLMATLSLSVVWLQTTASSTTSAWYATNVRLFQTLLVPVALLLVPLSSYIRIRWNSKSTAQKRAYTKATLFIGLGYGAFVAVVLFAASQLYIGLLLHLPVIRDFAIFVLFGAIVAFRSYSSIAYVVLDESAHLSFWTTTAVAAAVVLGGAASIFIDPLHSVDVYALVGGLLIIGVLLWNAARFTRPSSTLNTPYGDGSPVGSAGPRA